MSSFHEPSEVIVVFGDLLAVVFGAAAIVARRNRVATNGLALLGAASLAASIGMTLALAFASTRPLVSGGPRWPFETFIALEAAARAQWIAGAGAAIAIPILAVARALTVRRGRLARVALGVLGALVGAFAHADAKTTKDVIDGEDASPHARYRWIVEDRGPPATVARTLVASVGVAFTFAGIVGALRRRRVASRWRLVPGALALTLGAGLFIATRPLAQDASDPVPFWDDEYFAFDDTNVPAASLPCAEGYAQVEIDLDADLRVDGNRVTDLRTALDAKRALYFALSSKPTAAGLAASPTTSIADVRAAVAIARGAGFSRIFALTRRDRPPFMTASLGPIERRPRVCYVDLAAVDLGSLFAQPGHK